MRVPPALASFVSAAVLVAVTGPSAPAYAEKAAEPFSVTVAAPSATVGSAATFHVTITPAAGHHLNKEFPTSLKLVAPAGVELAKASLSGKDPAVKIAESAANFDVGFTPREAGKKVISGTLSFAVCTQTSCDPRKAPVSVTVDVK